MEFLIYGEESDESPVEEVKIIQEAVTEPEQEIVKVEPVKLSPLEVEIRELLGDVSLDVIEQYKNMEESIRNAYQEISSLDLPAIDPSPKQQEPIAPPEIETEVVTKIVWDPKELAEKKRIRFLKKHGVELSSELFGKVSKIKIPKAAVNQEYKRMFFKKERISRSEPELFSPAARTLPNVATSSPPAKRAWRPKSAFVPKKSFVHGDDVSEVPTLPKKVLQRPKTAMVSKSQTFQENDTLELKSRPKTAMVSKSQTFQENDTLELKSRPNSNTHEEPQDANDILSEFQSKHKRKKKKPKTPIPPPYPTLEPIQTDYFRLPLEFFDEPTRYEARTPQSILKENTDPGFYLEAYSKYHYILPDSAGWSNGGWKWTKCKVLEYDENNEMFKIEWEESKIQKWVRRFNLLFPGEKLADVSQRMEQASKARELYESSHMSAKMIEATTLDDVAPYPETFKIGIFQRIGRKIAKSERKFIEGLFDELEKDYLFAMKKTEYASKNNTVDTMHSSVNSEKFAAAVLTQSGAIEDDNTKILLGKVANAAKGLSEHMFSANAELQSVLLEVLSCLRKIVSNDQDFFSLHLHNTNEISFFFQRAKLNCESLLAKLIHDWPQSISSLIENRLSDYFNFQETSLKKYMENRSRSFLQLVNAVMEGQIHNLVINGFIRFLNFFSIGVETVGDDKPPNMLDAVFMNYCPTFNILKPAPPLRLISPFLKLQLNIKCPWSSRTTPPSAEELQIHPQNEIELFPNLDEIEPMLLELLQLPARLTQGCIPNVEGLLLTRLNLPSKYVKSLDSNTHQIAVQGGKVLSELISKVKPLVKELHQQYKEFEFLIREKYGENLTSKTPLEAFIEPIEVLTQARMRLQRASTNSVDFPPLVVDCSAIKQTLEYLTNTSFENIADILSSRIESQCKELLARYEPLSVNIRIDPGLVAQWWLTLQTSIDSTTREIGNFHQQFDDVQKTWNIMYNYNMVIPEDIQESYWTTFRWPSRMAEDLDDARERLEESRTHILNRIETEIGYVTDSTEAFISELDFFATLSDISLYENAKKQLEKISDLVESTLSLSASVNKQETAMGLTATEFDELQYGITQFREYQTLWQLVEDVHTHLNQWVNEWFMNLNADLMYKKVDYWNSVIQECESWFDLDSNPRNVTIQLKEDVDDFWRNTNVIAILRNPALKEFHWKRIHEIIGLSLVDFQGLRLVQILDLDLELVQSVISDICTEAEFTYKLEMNLDKMKNELSSSEFVVGPIPESESIQITNLSVACDLFEDQIIQCEKFYSQLNETESCLKFEKWLNQIQKALDMVRCIQSLQSFYIMMLPLIKLLEKEGSILPKDAEDAINSCFKVYTVAIDVFGKSKKFVNIIYRADLYEMMISGRDRIEVVMESLKPALRHTRDIFPRFYFVDDTTMIETLACSNPTQLSKCITQYFPSCFKLTESSYTKLRRGSQRISGSATSTERKGAFRSGALQKSPAINKNVVQKIANEMQVKTITGIVSHDGDIYTFKKQIEMMGNLPEELKELEWAAKQSLKDQFVDARISYQKNFDLTPRVFLEKYPIQTVVMLVRIDFSTQLLTALTADDENYFFNEYKARLRKSFNSMVDLNRNAMNVSLKMKVEAILVVLHFSTQQIEDFKEKSQLQSRTMKFYFNDDQMIQISFADRVQLSYGYEILTLDSKLVLTPTMHTHLLHIMSAVGHQRNVMVIGGHSAGKTGTIQEFGNLTGYRIAVFFCNDMSVYRLTNILRGSSLTNTWVVFKNFHQLQHQLHSLVSAQNVAYIKTTKDVPLKPRSIFGTISSIRDWNLFSPALRNSFKIHTLVKPDFGYIIEVYLFLNGFKVVDVLVKKLLIFIDSTKLIFHTQTTLSKIQQILRIAAQLRNQNPSLSEPGLIRQAITFVIKNHISNNDGPLIREMLNTIFKHPGEEAAYTRIPSNKINETIKSLHMVSSDLLTQKISSFFKYAEMRNSILIYGECFSSKSAIWKCAAAIANQLLPTETQVKTYHCFPRSFCSVYKEDGIRRNREFRQILDDARKYCSSKEEKAIVAEINCSFGWIVFDGEQKSSWFDSIDGMLGEMEHTETEKDLIQMIYESKTLADASPKILNRCSLIYVEPRALKVEMIIHNLLNKAPHHIFQMTPFINTIFQLIVLPAIKHMQSEGVWPSAQNVDKVAVTRVFKMFLALLDEKGPSGYERLTSQEQCLWVLYAFIFSTIWVIGADIDWNRRIVFDEFFRNHINDIAKNMEDFETAANLPSGYLKGAIIIPAELSVFDIFIDKTVIQWMAWTDIDQHELDELCAPGVKLTQELQKSNFFIHILMSCDSPVIIAGGAGVGKTTTAEFAAKLCISGTTSKFEQPMHSILLSGDMDILSFKSEFETALPRKRYNARGSKYGKRKLIFVDHLELFNYKDGMWDTFRMLWENQAYSAVDGNLESLYNVQLLGAYHAGASREYMYSQWARYFSVIQLHDNEKEKVSEILQEDIFSKLIPAFPTEIAQKVIDASMDTFSRIRQTFLKTPLNPQYMFTMNNVIVWIKALISYPVGQSMSELLYQWVHCSHRMFRDRITSNTELFDEIIEESLSRHFNTTTEKLTGGEDFSTYIQPDILISGRKNDLRIKDYRLVVKSLKYKATWMAELEADKVLYRQALQIACYCSFVIQNMSKNFVLAGMDYGNRLMLAKLSALMTKRKIFIFDPISADWTDFMSEVYLFLKERSKPIVIFLDSRFMNHSIWKDFLQMSKTGLPFFAEKYLLDPNDYNVAELTKRIRFCVSFPNMEDSENLELLTKYPALLNYALFHYATEIKATSVEDFIENQLSLRPLSGHIESGSIGAFLSWLKQDLPVFLRVNFPFESQLYFHVPESVFTLISTFFRLYSSHHDDKVNTMDKITEAIERIDASFESIKKTQEEYDVHLNGIANHAADTEAVMADIEVERLHLDDLYHKIKAEKDALQKNLEEIEYLQHFCVNEIEKLKPMVEEAVKKVQTLTRGDIYELKGLVEPSASVQLVMESVILLLKFELKVGEASWDAVKRMISERAFIQNATNAASESHVISQVVLHTVDRIQKSDAYNSAKLNNTAALLLRDWSNSVAKLHNVRYSLIPKKKLLQDTEVRVQTRESHIHDLQQEISAHETEMGLLKQKFQRMTKKNETAVYRIKEVELKLTTANGISPSLEYLKDKLLEKHKTLEDSLNTLVSACVMAACAVSLLGCFPNNIRKELIKRWNHGLQQFYLEDLPSNFDFCDILGPKLNPDPASVDLFAYETLLMAKNHHKLPLIIDPYTRTLETIRAVEKDGHIVIAHYIEGDYVGKIKSAMLHGSIIVLVLSESTKFKDVQEIVQLIKHPEEQNPDFERFRIYFVLTCELQKICSKSDWTSDFAPFKIFFCPEAAQSRVADAICSVHNADLRQKIAGKKNELYQSLAKKDLFLLRVMDFATKLVDDDIFGGELYKTMIDIQSQLDAVLFKVKHAEKSLNSITNDFANYEVTGSALSRIYAVVHDMKNISPNYLFDFEAFLEVCKEKASMLSAFLTIEELRKYSEEVYRTVYGMVAPGFKQVDRLIFSTFLALTIATIDLFSKDHIWRLPLLYQRFLFYALSDPFAKKPLNAKNNCKSWLSDTKWESIGELTKLPAFHVFAVEFGKFGNRATTPITEASWQEIHEAKDPSKTEFPSKWQVQLNRPERMLVTRALRPDALATMLEDICKTLLGPSVLDSGFPADLLLQRLSVSSAHKPIFVFHEGLEDELGGIAQLATLLGLEQPSVVSPAWSESDIQNHFAQNTVKGSWIILNLLEENSLDFTKIISKVTDWIRLQHGISINFRLWIVVPHGAIVPINILSASVKVYLEEERDFKCIFYESFLVLCSRAEQVKQSKNYYLRKTLFNLAFIFSVIKYRMRSFPLVIDNYVDMQLSDLKLGCQLVFEFFEKNPGQTSASKEMLFWHVFERVWGSQIVNVSNYRWFFGLFFEMINITWPSAEDKSDRANALPPLGNVYSCYCTDDFKQALEQIGMLPRGIDLRVETFGHCENISLFLESHKSKNIVQATSLLKPEIANLLPNTGFAFDTVVKTLMDFKSKIINETRFSWFSGNDVKTNRIALGRGEKPAPKTLDNLAKQNFQRYRKLIDALLQSIAIIIKQMNGEEHLDPSTLELARLIMNNQVPGCWKCNEHFFRTALPFSQWTIDLIARLQFMRVWYTSKYEGKASDTLIYLDISKIFAPEDLIPCILMEASHQMNEPIENLDLETIFVSERQKSAPERGCYVSGLYLYGASFDTHKNALRQPKPNEISSRFPCVWFMPKLKMTSEAAKKGSIIVRTRTKRVTLRIQIPIYVFKVFNRPFSSNHKAEDVESPIAGYVTVSSEHTLDYWTVRNTYLVCEKPIFNNSNLL